MRVLPVDYGMFNIEAIRLARFDPARFEHPKRRVDDTEGLLDVVVHPAVDLVAAAQRTVATEWQRRVGGFPAHPFSEVGSRRASQ